MRCFLIDFTGPTVNSGEVFSVSGVGLTRLLYNVEDSGSIRELNNSYQYPNEAFIADVSSQANGGNTGTPIFGNTTANMPSGMVVATGIPNGKVSMAAGFRGKEQQLWLFNQAAEHKRFRSYSKSPLGSPTDADQCTQ